VPAELALAAHVRGEPSGEVSLAPLAQAVKARHRSMPGFLRTGNDGRRDHQNEAMSNNKVAHVASVPAAMKTACGLVGSSSSSDIANSLSRWGFKVGRGVADPSIGKRRQADYPIGLRPRWLSAGLLFSQINQPARTGLATPPRAPTFRNPSAAARRAKLGADIC
jgi:hypothetical protein